MLMQLKTMFDHYYCRGILKTSDKCNKNTNDYLLVVGHWLEIIIDHRLESVAAVDAIFWL